MAKKRSGKIKEKKPPKLTLRQQKFVREYVKCGNGAKAALQAGYSAHSGRQQGARLLCKAHIQAEIAKFRTKLVDKLEISAERVLSEYAKIAFTNMDDFIQVTEQGDAFIDLSKMTRDQAAALSEVMCEDFTEGRGDDARDVRRLKIKFHSKTQALDALAKHLNLFSGEEPTDDRTPYEININLVGPKQKN